MSKSDYFENALLLLTFNGTAMDDIAEDDSSSPATTLTFALHTADPGDAGDMTTNEAGYTGYVRQTVNRNSGGFTVTTDTAATVADVVFPASTGTGTTLTHFSIGTGVSGRILYKGVLSLTIPIADGTAPKIIAGPVVADGIVSAVGGDNAAGRVEGWDESHVFSTVADFYVDGAVSSSGNGTSLALAFKTIEEARAAATVLPGPVTVAVKAGVYREAVDFSGNTTDITIHGYGAEKPIMDGSDTLTGWVACDSGDDAIVGATNRPNMYKTTILNGTLPAEITPDVMDLHEDNVRMPLAYDRADRTTPDIFRENEKWFVADQFVVNGSNVIQSIRDTDVFANYTQAQLENAFTFIFTRPNTATRAEVTTFDGTDLSLSNTAAWQSSSPSDWKYALYNIVANIEVGQYGYKVESNGDITVYCWPASAANLTSNISYTVRTNCVDTGGASNIHFKGFEFRRTAGDDNNRGVLFGNRTNNVQNPRKTNISLEHCYFHDVMFGDGGYGLVYLTGVDNIKIDQCTFGYAGNSLGCFIARSSDGHVKNCLFENSTFSSFRIYGAGGTSGNYSENWIIDGNKFVGAGRDTHANKMNFYEGCNNILVIRNDFEDCYGYFTWQETSNLYFMFNKIPGDNRPADTGDNRAVQDQNHQPDAEPDAAGAIWLVNNFSPPAANKLTSAPTHWALGYEAPNSIVVNTANNVFHGLNYHAAMPVGGKGLEKNNLFTDMNQSMVIGDFDASSLYEPNLALVYADAANGDFTPTGTIWDNAGYDVTTELITALAIKFPTVPLNKDFKGNTFDWATEAFIGAEIVTPVAEVTAPVLTSATDAANGSVAATGSVSTDEANGTLYWVVTTSATAPTAAQVKLGQDNSGASASADGSQAVSGTGAQNITPGGLTASTAYTTHFMHEDAAANQSSVASASGFTTVASDVTAPILSSASVGTLTAIGGTLAISTDEANGTLYWMVDANATRTAAQVKSGGGIDSGSQAVSGTGVQAVIVSDGGSASTLYYFHAMHEDAATNQSTVVSTSFTTEAAASSVNRVTWNDDATVDVLSSTASITDNKVFYFYCNIQPAALTGNQVVMYFDEGSFDSRFRVENSTGKFSCLIRNNAGNIIAQIATTNGLITTEQNNVLIKVDSDNNMTIVLDNNTNGTVTEVDVATTGTGLLGNFDANTILLGATTTGGASKYIGDSSVIMFGTGDPGDITTQGVQDKFWNSTTHDPNVTQTGAEILFDGGASDLNAGTNSGSLGGFSMTGGVTDV